MQDPLIELLPQDVLGYYTCDTIKFYSKLEAYEFAKDHPEKVKWHFNDEVYSSYDWTVEPTESLAELYRQRAHQLRDKYDYVVLWFSGGADSNNVLNSFIDNDIKLDEVVSMINYSATGDKENYLNGEIFHVASPKIITSQAKQPHLHHRFLDLAQPYIDFFSERESIDWVYGMNDLLNPNNIVRQEIKLKIPEWAKMILDGKKVGFIWGTCKPRVMCLNGKYIWAFEDAIQGQSKDLQTVDKDWDFNELFYWSPDLPKLCIKQAHVIKNYMKSSPPNDPNMVKETFAATCLTLDVDVNTWPNPWNVSLYELGLMYAHKNPKTKILDSDKVHSLIYPGWIKVPFQIKGSIIFTPRDTWFFELSENTTKAKYNWRVGMEHLWKHMPEYRKRRAGLGSGLHKYASKNYFIGE